MIPFKIDETVTFSQLEEKINENKLSEIILPIDRVLEHLDVYRVSKDVKWRVLNGQKLSVQDVQIETNPFKVMHQNELLAIYERHRHDQIKPIRVFQMYKD